MITRICKVGLSTCLVTLGISPLFAAPATPENGTPSTIVVTLEPKRGKEIPQVSPSDIQLREAGSERSVSALTPLQGGMQLMLLIDNSATGSFGTEISTLKEFIASLPSTTQVSVGYMQNGYTSIAQNFTADHTAAANAVRLPMGPAGADVDPYGSLADAIKKWPNSESPRKEVIMVSSGIEGLGGGLYQDNPYVTAGIQAALKAGVIVYTIYNPSVGHFGHDYWRYFWGQNFLSELSDRTGGESFMVGFGSPVSFQPFLNDARSLMQHQFLLTFIAKPESKSGLQPIHISIPAKDASVAGPASVFVKAST